jgi:acetolactate synthase-1/2/3 large subunit
MPRLTGAQALVEQLRAEGVDTVFALPGVQIMAAFDALHEHQNHMRVVHVRHEQATTYMADGYARAGGRVGVAMTVPGPGALNASAGLGTAFACSSPVLLISGQIPSEGLGKHRGELHEVEDQLDVFRPITKWNHRVTRPEEVPGAVREAFRQLTTGRARPVELEIPPDTLAAAGEVEILEPVAELEPAPDAGALAEAAGLLLAAKRPAIVAGGGAMLADAAAELVAVAERLSAPVVTTAQGKGAFPPEHPLSAGSDYFVGPLPAVLEHSDLILAVGTRLRVREYSGVAPRVVRLDADPAELERSYPTTVGIVADARAGLAALLEVLGERRREDPQGVTWAAALRDAVDEDVRRFAPAQLGMLEALRAGLDDDAIVVSGMTNVAYWSNVAFPAPRPRTFLTSSYFGTLGYAYPTALGAKVAHPDRQVVALCGDGGFLFNPQELSTAVRHGIDLVAVVFNNGAYGASYWDQTQRYGQRYIGTDLHNPDFLKLADAFGVRGLRTDPGGLGAALREALAGPGPALVEVEMPLLTVPPFQVVR